MAKVSSGSTSSKKTTRVSTKRVFRKSKKDSSVSEPVVAYRKKNKSSGASAVSAKSVTVVQYVLPLGNGWVVKSSNSKSFAVITDSREEAISMGRTLAKTKHTDLVVHYKNGKIARKESYS